MRLYSGLALTYVYMDVLEKKSRRWTGADARYFARSKFGEEREIVVHEPIQRVWVSSTNNRVYDVSFSVVSNVTTYLILSRRTQPRGG